jgi:hypothetical protein
MDWITETREQLGWHWINHIRPHLEGLTDQEYVWEPAPGCWNLRRRGDSKTALAAGSGQWVMDFEYPEPQPPPVTTIAWRLGHVIVGLFAMRSASHFGGPPVDYQSADWSPTANGAIAQLDSAYDRWTAGVSALSARDWDRPLGSAEGPWASSPFGALVLHINREAIHHMAEVLLLRDLYRNQPQGDKASNSTLRPKTRPLSAPPRGYHL